MKYCPNLVASVRCAVRYPAVPRLPPDIRPTSALATGRKFPFSGAGLVQVWVRFGPSYHIATRH